VVTLHHARVCINGAALRARNDIGARMRREMAINKARRKTIMASNIGSIMALRRHEAAASA